MRKALVRLGGSWLVLLWAAGVLAAPSELPTIEARLGADGRGRGEVTIVVTSHNEALTGGTLHILDTGGILARGAVEHGVTLPAGGPAEVTERLHPNSRGYGAITARLVDDGGETAAVNVFYFAFGARGEARQLDEAAYQELILAEAEAKQNGAARAKAAKLLRKVLDRGGRPVVSGQRPVNDDAALVAGDSALQRAWNELVTEMNGGATATPLLPGECGLMRISPYNYTAPVRGRVWYDDEYYFSPGQRLNVREGFTGQVRFYVEYIDDCGNIEYRLRSWNFTTQSDGSFSIAQISTIDDPYYYDPVSTLTVTAPDAGNRSCAGTCATINTVPLTIFPPDDQYAFINGTIDLQPVFTANNNTQRYLFRWQNEIRSLQSRWSAAGFSSTYTSFKAGYDNSITQGAYFWPQSPGLVVFNFNYRWTSKWVMAHEFGHHFQFKLQGNRWAGDAVPHGNCTRTNGSAAFNEGFASWHASYWESEGRSAAGITCSSGECYSTCGPGYTVEGNVLAYFWDVFDGVNSSTFDRLGTVPQDSMQKSLSILKAWELRPYTSFDDFYYNYYGRGFWAPDEYAANALRYVNGVDIP